MLLTCFLYSDSIATGLVNALLNSGDNFQMEKGRGFLKRLNKQLKKRKRAEDQQDENWGHNSNASEMKNTVNKHSSKSLPLQNTCFLYNPQIQCIANPYSLIHSLLAATWSKRISRSFLAYPLRIDADPRHWTML